MQNTEKKRIPVNKPERFIEYLNLLNLLPDSLDDFLRSLSKLSRKWSDQEEKLKEVQSENAIRIRNGKELLSLSPEEQTELNYPYDTVIKRNYVDFVEGLPFELRNYMKANCPYWRYGEKKLNMFAVERESIELIISQRKLWHELQKDFQEWKQSISQERLLDKKFQEMTEETFSTLTDKELYENFCIQMKHWGPTIEKFNAEKYRYSMPNAGLDFFLPNINEKLHYHRGTIGQERRGFAGFFTRLATEGDFLDIAAEGLIGIVLQQKLNGEPRFEIDRLRHCESCNKFLYAYKGNQVFCSTTCYNANYQQNNRKGRLGLLKRQLKKANARLKNLEGRLDSDSGLVKDQLRKIEEIKIQIKEEKI